MKSAIFPGSFDPFTRGHEAIVEQALRLFDRVVIAVGENVSKKSLLSPKQRLRLIEDLYADESRVECISYRSLTIDVAREVGASAIIRGVRNTLDFEYERTMAQTNRRLAPELETVLLFTPAELMDVSSSTVRELLAFGRNVEPMMPAKIQLKEYLEE